MASKNTTEYKIITRFEEEGASKLIAVTESIIKKLNQMTTIDLTDSVKDFEKMLVNTKNLLSKGISGDIAGAKYRDGINSINDSYRNLLNTLNKKLPSPLTEKEFQRLEDAKNKIEKYNKALQDARKENKELEGFYNKGLSNIKVGDTNYTSKDIKEMAASYGITSIDGTKLDARHNLIADEILTKILNAIENLNLNRTQKNEAKSGFKNIQDTVNSKYNKNLKTISDSESGIDKAQNTQDKLIAKQETYINTMNEFNDVLGKYIDFAEKVMNATDNPTPSNIKSATNFPDNETKKNAEENQQEIHNLKGAERTGAVLVNKYLSLYAILRAIRRIATEVYKVTKDLDKAFNEIAVVTQYSTSQVWDMYDSFLKLANVTGTTSTEIIKLVGEYTKQGKSMTEALQLTEAAAMAANVAGVSATESVKYLTSALNGYKLSAEEAMNVSDKFAKLAAVSATDYEDIATALTKVAAQANAAGVEMDSLMGFMTTALEVTQEAPENIGTAFKTIFARMGEIKDLGTATEDATNANQVSKALSTIGVALFDTQGQMRDLDDVLMDVGEKWNTLDSVQQKYIATALAGTRQQTRLIAIFQDWDKTMKYVKASQNATGATLAQQAKKAQGLEYALTQLTNAWESFVQSIASSDAIKGIINTLSDLINTLSKLPNNLIVPITLGMAALLGVIYQFDAEKNTFGGIIGAIGTVFNKIGDNTAKIKQLVIAKLANATASKLEASSETASAVASKVATAAKDKETLATITLKEATEAYMATNPVGWIMLVIAALATLVIAIAEVHHTAKESNEVLQEIYGNIYNRDEAVKSVEDLANQYQKLNDKIVKTSEDLKEMNSIASQINDTAGSGYGIITSSGKFNNQEYERYLKEQEETSIKEMIKASKEFENSWTREYKSYINAYNNEDADSYTKEMARTLQIIQNMYGKVDEEAIRTYRSIINGSDEAAKEQIDNAEKIANAMLAAGENFTIKKTYTTWVSDGNGGTSSAYQSTGHNETITNDTNVGLEEFIKNTFQDEKTRNALLNGSEQLSEEIIENIFNTLTDGENKDKFINAYSSVYNELGIVSQMLANNMAENAKEAYNEILEWVKNYGSMETVSEAFDIFADSGLDKSKAEDFIELYSKISNTISNGGEIAKDTAYKFTALGVSTETLAEIYNSLTTKLRDTNSTLSSLKSISNQVATANESFSSGNIDDVLTLMEAYPGLSQEMLNSLINEGEISEETTKKIQNSLKEKLIAQLEFRKEELRIKAREAADTAAIYRLEAEAGVEYTQQNVEELNNRLNAKANYYSGLLQMASEYGNKINAAENGEDVSPITYDGTLDTNKYKEQLDAKADAWEAIANRYTTEADAIRVTINGINSGLIDLTGQADKTQDTADALNELANALEKIAGLEKSIGILEALKEQLRGSGNASGVESINTQLINYKKSLQSETQSAIELAKEQAALVKTQYSSKVWNAGYIDSTGRLLVNMEKYSKLTTDQKKEFEDMQKEYNGYLDNVSDYYTQIIKYETEIQDLEKESRDKQIEAQDALIQAIKNRQEKIYENQKEILEKEKELLEKRKQMYEDAFNDADYNKETEEYSKSKDKLQKQLAALDGANDSKSKQKRQELLEELNNLNKEYNEKTTDYYRESLNQRLDTEIEMNEKENSALEKNYNKQIEDYVYFQEQINEITKNSWEEAVEFLKAYSDEYINATELGQEKIVDEWSSLLSEVYGNNETQFGELIGQYQDYVSDIINLTEQAKSKQNELAKNTKDISNTSTEGNPYSGYRLLTDKIGRYYVAKSDEEYNLKAKTKVWNGYEGSDAQTIIKSLLGNDLVNGNNYSSKDGNIYIAVNVDKDGETTIERTSSSVSFDRTFKELGLYDR